MTNKSGIFCILMLLLAIFSCFLVLFFSLKAFLQKSNHHQKFNTVLCNWFIYIQILQFLLLLNLVSITENLLTTTSYAIFSLYFIFKYSYWPLFTASFYQWIVFTYDLKKNYAIILFKQWPGSKWIFDLSHKVLLRESIFYSN